MRVNELQKPGFLKKSGFSCPQQSQFQRVAILFLLLVAGSVLGVACGRDKEQPTEQVDRVKLAIVEPGIYRVTVDELRDAGLDVTDLDAQRPALMANGQAIPYLIDEDALLFYGVATDNRFAAAQSYIVSLDVEGALMQQAVATTDGAEVTSVRQTVRLEENHFYDPRAFQTEVSEVWFWETIRNLGESNQLMLTVVLPAVDDSAAADLRINLYGATYDNGVEGDHTFDLVVNGQAIDTVQWDGQTHFTAAVTVPPGVLKEGDNSITIDNSAEGATLLDIMLLNWLELTYDMPLAAFADAITFDGAEGVVTLDADDLIVLDIADPNAPVRMGSSVIGDSDTFAVSDDMRIAAADSRALKQPAAIEPIVPTAWRDATNQADLLIVTTTALAPELEPLVSAREAEGITTAVVPVEAIYDEFGYGDPTPDAINAFVTYAVEQWAAPAPAYLLLVGDATTDTRGYLAQRPDNPVELPANIVPSPLIAVSHAGETVSDARLADVDGDLKPDLAVGRWPVADPEGVRDLVARTLAYENGVSAETALFTMDGTSDEFSGFTSRLLEKTTFPAGGATLLDGPNAQTVADSWNDGAWLISYVGHGSLDLWGKDEVFSAEQVSTIADEAVPPIVLQFTCLSGQFAHPEVESLSETLIKHESGPVLLIAATSLTLSSNQEPFAVALLEALQDPSIERIGDAFQHAKASLNIADNSGLQEISDTFGLLGDPSARIVRPATAQSAAAGN